MLMSSVMALKPSSTDGFYLQYECLAHDSAPRLSRCFLAPTDSGAFQLRYIDMSVMSMNPASTDVFYLQHMCLPRELA